DVEGADDQNARQTHGLPTSVAPCAGTTWCGWWRCLNSGTKAAAIASEYSAKAVQMPCQSLTPSGAVNQWSITKPATRLPSTAPMPLVISMYRPCALARILGSACCSTNSEPEILKKSNAMP